ncbi:hypothetical protein A3A93_04200 [Candidatus Roizmanbacteria bacterium RIFCSPLOWO2_01_FULL_38_12]|uniref:Uncharacterized protein n=1 Tax=Candidatus Roizmanbacteria bacterium RIFCSPLOWO2_01_FULL_38_12 TaxID=1802061 RepID=A0A1F7IV21_9BACT|nr:MAG: hypothetical protein A2861_04450 [Candidatus Roizmanbacteria bacterium RIFCSPHIGHO2_01_FULL_38_15]OGK35050.1 MAG: hypothetical protein A3F59_00370 [Candidatus Roizmanbacteria bacterium RIFCSPHIGHO2_12_FULL_38_13]OGK47205.1 MAG: hypothetical protein A3A93_04200 [Candidatus Roizmanbacteria bacterium RIFCSPLOWO2_01_FULL_38_12]
MSNLESLYYGYPRPAFERYFRIDENGYCTFNDAKITWDYGLIGGINIIIALDLARDIRSYEESRENSKYFRNPVNNNEHDKIEYHDASIRTLNAAYQDFCNLTSDFFDIPGFLLALKDANKDYQPPRR